MCFRDLPIFSFEVISSIVIYYRIMTIISLELKLVLSNVEKVALILLV